MRVCTGGVSRVAREAAPGSHPRIFFLTFDAKNLIKGTQPRSLMSGAKFDVKGESIDEERNQEESARQEEGCSEEKEVAGAGSLVRVQSNRPRAIGADFLFGHLRPLRPSRRPAQDPRRAGSSLKSRPTPPLPTVNLLALQSTEARQSKEEGRFNWNASV